MRAPDFWNRPSLLGYALSPIGMLYSAISTMLQSTHVSAHADIPIIAVGNAVLGGAGKTPVTIALAQLLRSMNEHPHILSRGYGGSAHHTPHRVNPQTDTAKTVGDEPLLLARIAPTWVHKKRILSAQAATKEGTSVAVMDDGLQHTSLHRDLSILVIDTVYNNGNGHVFPAGPLRERFASVLNKTDAIVLLGKQATTLNLPSHIPQFRALITPSDVWAALKGKPVIAFAGLATPRKFFALCEASGLRVVEDYPFPDHYCYTRADMRQLIEDANARNAVLVTTEKDAVKLHPDDLAHVTVLPIHISWQDVTALQQFLAAQLATIRAGATK